MASASSLSVSLLFLLIKLKVVVLQYNVENAWKWPDTDFGSKNSLCRTPGGLTGTCVPLDKCPRIKAMTDFGWTYQTLMFMEQSACNRHSSSLHVCCTDAKDAGSQKSPQILTTVPPLSSLKAPEVQVFPPLVRTTTNAPSPRPVPTAGQIIAPAKPEKSSAAETVALVPDDHFNMNQQKPEKVLSTNPQPPEVNTEGINQFRTRLEERIEKHPNLRYLPDDSECGFAYSIPGQDRIVGGEVAALGEFPWMALLNFKTKKPVGNRRRSVFACGGSLINANYVITAAHCIENIGDFQLDFVRLGEHNITSEIDCEEDRCAPPVQDIGVQKILTHPRYNEKAKIEYDISLLRLKHPVKFNQYVTPVCLPRKDALYRNLTASKTSTVAGWGRTHTNAAKPGASTVLQFVRIPVTARKVCLDRYKANYGLFGYSRFCGGGQTGKDSCKGDSGGPLMDFGSTKEVNINYLYGIVSAGPDSCTGTVPALYTNVTFFVPWILDNLEP